MAELSGSSPSSRGEFLQSYLRAGWGIIALVFGGLIAWSVFAPFEGAVLTSGQISVASNQQAVQHLEGGIVREIYVRESDAVTEGQKLLSLDSTATGASLQGLEARLFGLLGNPLRQGKEVLHLISRNRKTTQRELNVFHGTRAGLARFVARCHRDQLLLTGH